MRRRVKYFFLLFVISIFLGFIFAKQFKEDEKISVKNITLEKHNTSLTYEENDKILETAFQDEKIISTTKLILKKSYFDCKHNIEKEVELPKELINLTKEELEVKFSDWKIEKFSPEEVILYKNIYGLCGEHFIIESGDEFIEVYSLDEEYDKELYEITNTSIEYLAKEDLEKLEEGIYVYGIEELNSTLENFE